MSIALFALVSTAQAGLLCYEYRYAPNLVQAVQRKLQEQGFYSGSIDGKYGPHTREAVRKFQIAKKIRVAESRMTLDSDVGELESQTLEALFGDKAPEGVSRVKNPHSLPERIWAESCL